MFNTISRPGTQTQTTVRSPYSPSKSLKQNEAAPVLERMRELALLPGWRARLGEPLWNTRLSFCKVNRELPYPQQTQPWARIPETRKHMLPQNSVHSVRLSSSRDNQTREARCPAGIGRWNQLWPNSAWTVTWP